MFGESYKDYLDDRDDAAMWDREEYLEVLGIEPQDDWDDGGSADDERLAWAALCDDDNLPEEDEYEDVADDYDEEEDEGDEREDREPQADGYTPAVPVTPEIPMPCDFLDEDEIPF